MVEQRIACKEIFRSVRRIFYSRRACAYTRRRINANTCQAGAFRTCNRLVKQGLRFRSCVKGNSPNLLHVLQRTTKNNTFSLLCQASDFCISGHTVFQQPVNCACHNGMGNASQIAKGIYILDLDCQIFPEIRVFQCFIGIIGLVHLLKACAAKVSKVQPYYVIEIALHRIWNRFKNQPMGSSILLAKLEQGIARPTKYFSAVSIAFFQISNLGTIESNQVIASVGNHIDDSIHAIQAQTTHIPRIQLALYSLAINIQSGNFRNLKFRLEEISVCLTFFQSSFRCIFTIIGSHFQRILKSSLKWEYIFHMGIPIGIHILKSKVTYTLTGTITGGHNKCICIFHISGSCCSSGKYQRKEEGKKACPNNTQYMLFVAHNLSHFFSSIFIGK